MAPLIRRLLTVAIIIVTGILLGAGGYTFYYAQGFSYLSDDPGVCVNCHIMREQFDSWERSSHRARAACGECHLPQDFFNKWRVKAENGLHHSIAFTFGNFREPIRIKEGNSRVLNENCLYCHEDFVREIAAHRNEEAAGISCVRCHVKSGHALNR
ncbi:MAG TPA: cytochrome c nitrite reductase small subunit [Acidobacteriota bacterium]|nr:cytochrome c nitrite reductase small subunit [Acidobacteriota bacterium]